MSVSHPALLVAPEQPLADERVRATTALRRRPSETRIICDGMRHGEFRDGDARRASRCIYTAVLRHVHPGLIVCDGPGEPSLGEMVDFCLAALG